MDSRHLAAWPSGMFHNGYSRKSWSWKALISFMWIVASLLFVAPLPAATIHVDDAVASSGDGTTWAKAKKTVGEALDAAKYGDSVWVAEGTYREFVVIAKSGIALYGGFHKTETQPSLRNLALHPTIIDASTAYNGRAAYHGVLIPQGSPFEGNYIGIRLDGFVITGASASGGFSERENCGGGICCDSVNNTNTIANCVIIDNSAAKVGGGIYCISSSPVISNCIISGNRILPGSYAPQYAGGGGVYCESSSPTISQCAISGNFAVSGNGAGINCQLNSAPKITNCVISDNVTSGLGGGVYGNGVYGSIAPLVLNCTILSNTAPQGGGVYWCGEYHSSITNTILSGNTGYAIFEESSITGTLPSHDLALTCCLFDDNPSGEVRDDTGHPLWSAMQINTDLADACNNLNGDPRLAMNGPQALSGTWTATAGYEPATHCTTLVDSATTFVTGALAGRLITLKRNQSPQRQALILTNTNTSITVLGDASGYGAVGAGYTIVDYHLLNGSAALDQGGTTNAPAIDFEGDLRPGSDNRVDIGADEAPTSYVPQVGAVVSHVRGLDTVQTATVFAVPWIYWGASNGLNNVALYYRRNGGPWTRYGETATSSPFSFDSSATGGAGDYEFYTIATDNDGHVQVPPDTPDARTLVRTDFAGLRIYVDRRAGGKRNGETWADAFTDIGSAMAAAQSLPLAQIWVAEGRYPEAVKLTSNIALYGAFAGGETGLSERVLAAHPTVIDGCGAEHAITLDGATNSRLDGFTITGGYADDAAGSMFHLNMHGGGIHCNGVDKTNTIANCLITGNFAGAGAGLCLVGSAPVIANCTISSNYTLPGSPAEGAGVCCFASSPTLSDCTIINQQSRLGAGLYCEEGSNPQLTRCSLSANQAEYGGGAYCKDSAPVFLNCTISGNTAGLAPAMLFEGSNAKLSNCTIDGNETSETMAIYCSGSSPAIENCVISSNRGGLTCYGNSSPAVSNTIFESNTQVALVKSSADCSPVLDHCLFHGNPDGDYQDEAGRRYKGAWYFNEILPNVRGTISGDPMFAMDGAEATTGTWTTTPVFDRSSSCTTLVDSAATFIPGALRGRLIRIGGPGRMHGYITNNTTTTMEVAGDLTARVKAGDPYTIIDYHLRNGSAALDHGTTTTAPAADFEGDLRPGGDGQVDIGVDEAAESFTPQPDRIPPQSRVGKLPPLQTTLTFYISWSATDEESGVRDMRLFYRRNSGPWTQYGDAVTTGPIPFDASTGGDGHYEFYTLATDNLDNVEPTHLMPDAETAVVTSAGGARVYVDPQARGTQTGESWANALHDLVSAQTLTKLYQPREIWAAGGVYATSLTLTSAISFYGGFAGGESTLAERHLGEHPSIIDGSTAGAGGGRANHVIIMDGITSSTLDGFTITGGLWTYDDRIGAGILCLGADGSNTIAHCTITANDARNGAGIYCLNASPLIRDCTITNNNGEIGGGLLCDHASPTVVDCTFQQNIAEMGGAIYCNGAAPRLTRCIITATGGSNARGLTCRANSAPVMDGCEISYNAGGGLDSADSTLVLNHCRVVGNRSTFNGGGIVASNSPLDLTDCVIAGNNASKGGGLALTGGVARLAGCAISCNTSLSGLTSGGGGLYCEKSCRLTLLNCLLNGNQAVTGGGAIQSYDKTCVLTVTNCTLSGNTAANGGGLNVYGKDYAQLPVVTNSIFTDNGGHAIDVSVECPIVRNCLFYNNDDGDFYGYTSGTRSGITLSELPGFSHLVLGDPNFMKGTCGLWSAPPVYDQARNRTTLTDADAEFELGALAGRTLSTDSGQRSLALIVANTSTTLEVIGDQTALAHVGGAYQFADYHLGYGSAAIDTGTSVTAPAVDLAGVPRPVDIPGMGADGVGAAFDLGAYEVQPYTEAFPGDHQPVMGAEPTWTAGTSNTVTWISVGATTYTVQCARDRFFTTIVAAAEVSAPGLAWTFTGLSDDERYFYRVRAQGPGGQAGPWSEPVWSVQDATPPRSRVTTPGTTTQHPNITITWEAEDPGARASGVQSIEIFWSKDGVTTRSLGVMPPEATTITLNPLDYSGDGNYSFYSIATDHAGNRQSAPTGLDITIHVERDPNPHIIYVDHGMAASGDGKSWATALKTIGEAIALAVAGDQVWVAEGRYQEAISLLRGVQFFGGFAKTEQQLSERDIIAHPTIVDASTVKAGAPAGRVVLMDHVVNTRLDGFTITGGQAATSNAAGGGILCDSVDGSNVIANCTIGGNKSSVGAGLYLLSWSTPLVTNCIIRDNIATANDQWGGLGGGILFEGSPYPLTFRNCLISGNTARLGGGLFLRAGTIRFENCVIENNTGQGGGLYSESSMVTIVDSMVRDNKGGGGLYLVKATGYLSKPALTIENSTILGNTSSTSGGGIYWQGTRTTIKNSIIAGNKSGAKGGGIYCEEYPGARIYAELSSECKITGNTAAGDGGGLYALYSDLDLVNLQITGNGAPSGRGGAICLDHTAARVMNGTIDSNTARNGGGIYLSAKSTLALSNSILCRNVKQALYHDDSGNYPAVSYCAFHANPDGDYFDRGLDLSGKGAIYTGAAAIDQNLPLAHDNRDGEPGFLLGPAGRWSQKPAYQAVTNRTTLADATARFAPGALIGRTIDTNTSQTLHAYVTANTTNTVEVVGNVLGFTGSGHTYRILDYHLGPDSSAIDTGTAEGAPPQDIEGSSRPAGQTFDIGAYEARVTLQANNGLAIGSVSKMHIIWPVEGQPFGTLGFDIYRSSSGQPGSYDKINAEMVTGGSYWDLNLAKGIYFYTIYLIDEHGVPIQWAGPFAGTITTTTGARDWPLYD